MESRIGNTKNNIGFSLLNYSVKIFLNFVMRVFFIRYFGVAYLGLNGLFGNILSVLSLAELGFGVAIVFSMYKPMAQKDYETVKSLLRLYKKVYFIMGTIILAIGLVLLPFLNVLIADSSEIPGDISIYIIYIIFLIQSVISYFFAHRRSLLFTSQRNDIESKIALISLFCLNVAQLIVILFYQNYYVYIGLTILFSLLENLIIYIVTKKMFPQINNIDVKTLDAKLNKSIKKNIYAMMCHKVGSVIVYSTDSIIISAFLGITVLGIYSNYLLIISAITSILTMILLAIKGSIGNLIAKTDNVYSYSIFKKLNFAYFWLVGFCAISLMCLMNPFVLIWIGNQYVIDTEIVFLLVVSFYTLWVKNVAGSFKECAGLFYQDRYKSIVEASINLIVSIILVNLIGLPGVILGTIISTIGMPLWVEPYVLFKHYFKKPVRNYWKEFVKYFVVTVIIGLITFYICYLIPNIGMGWFLLKVAICAVVPNSLFFLCYFRTKEFKYFIELLKEMLTKLKNKKKQKFLNDITSEK